MVQGIMQYLQGTQLLFHKELRLKFLQIVKKPPPPKAYRSYHELGINFRHIKFAPILNHKTAITKFLYFI